MRISFTVGELVSGTLGLAAVALAWFFLAPSALGGSTTYVSTDGVSMAPRFHTGDLAVVRPKGDYRVGEIVAYRSRLLHTIVLHRLIGRAGDRYLFKGDNNDFVDPERPTADQLVGELWFRLPGVGKDLGPLHSPLAVGLLVALGSLLLGGGAFTRRRRRRHRRGDDAGKPKRPPRTRHLGDTVHEGLVYGSLALLAFVALGILAFSRPTKGPVPTPVAYTQSGSFTYWASAPGGTAYPSGRATTGDPLFLRLVHDVHIRFAYRFDTAARHRVRGTVSLLATLASSNGWKRTLRIAPATPFSGDRAVVTGTLSLRALPELLARLEAATAISAGAYTLTVQPHLTVDGTVAGTALNTVFAPSLPFSLDSLQLQPTFAAGGAEPKADASVSTTTREARTLSLELVHLDVATARLVSAIGAFATLCALLVAGFLLLRRGGRGDEPARIAARYRDWLVPVAHVDPDAAREVVKVDGIETLARLAERYERMILHETSEHGHTYHVADDGVHYVYVVGEEARPAPTPAPPSPVSSLPRVSGPDGKIAA